ncbi:MAG: AraC family transcriptional regulator [Myxococcaceae bacterium]|nr:AraC family transcriptional regulator [Myxococcaceae bacterium]MCI0669399.1 AraC family transcriptional regulator [Myxococcaceae bacterium]
MSEPVAFFEASELRVLDSRCRKPRSAPGSERGGEPIHLALLSRGCFAYQRGRRTHLGDPCTALLHQAGSEYRIGHPGEDGDDATLFVLAPALAEELFGARLPDAPEIPLAARTQLLHARVRAALCGRSGDALEQEERTMELLLAVSSERAARVRRARGWAQRRAVERARALLAAQPATNLSLDEIAREAGCSPFHLMRLFRAETGRSLRAYRRELRVAAALPRLAGGEPDLAALALELGFSHHSHLSECFRRVLGVSPRAVRAELRGAVRARS